jgi:hypothetical protein
MRERENEDESMNDSIDDECKSKVNENEIYTFSNNDNNKNNIYLDYKY